MNETPQDTFDPQNQGARDAATTVRHAAETITDKVEAAYEETKRQVSTSKRAVKDYLDDKRAPTADALDRTASSLRNTSNRSMKAVCDATDRAAGRMERAAAYLRSSDTEAILSDSKELVRRHPVPLMVAGVVAGLYVARVLFRPREQA